MKTTMLSILSACIFTTLFGQQKQKTAKDTLLTELSTGACNCIDSISVFNRPKADVTKDINKCISASAGAYQLGAKLASIDLNKGTADKDGKKQINISINTNQNSSEYKEYYYEMERYLMDNCKAIKEKIAANDKQSDKSFSPNPEATDLYSKGIDESKKENYDKAIDYFQKALKIDAQFAFAWDNMGLCYRKLGNYDKAIEAYKKSLELDPRDLLPLQNIAVAYQYKKEYQLAIDAYNKLAEIDKNNPETFYGIGQIYAAYLQDYEKGLSNICKAYNLYNEQKSAYRTDAEKLIQLIYAEMKKQGKEEAFTRILKENNISTK